MAIKYNFVFMPRMRVFLISLALLLTACSGNGGGATSVSGPIKLGAVMPLTGGAADYGVMVQRVAGKAVDEINAKGGINGRRLELVWEDGKCSGKDATTAVKKLIEMDHVQAIYGAGCSPEVLASGPIAQENHVVMLTPLATNPNISQLGDYVFRNAPSDVKQATLVAEYAYRKDGVRRMAILTELMDYATALRDGMQRDFTAMGGQILDEDFASDAHDFKTSLLKLKNFRPDGIYLAVGPSPVTTMIILRQMQELGFKPKGLYGSDGFLANIAVNNAISQYREFLEGAIAAEITYNADSAGFKALTQWYKETYKENIVAPSYAALSYDAVYILAEAIAKVGYSGPAIKDELSKLQGRDGLAGTLTFDANGDPTSGHELRVIRSGKVEKLVGG